MFTENEKGTFAYWFAHWCSFQMVALNLHCWRFKFLFHDIEKPWLNIFLSKDKAKKFHKTHNKHHLKYRKGPEKCDFESMVIDWECSKYTKTFAPRGARGTYEYNITTRYDKGIITDRQRNALIQNVPPILERLGL